MEYNKNDNVDPKLLSHPLFDNVFIFLVLNSSFFKSTTFRQKTICSIFNMRVKEKKRKKKTPPTGLEPAIFGSQISSHLTTDRRPTPYPLGHGGGMLENGEKGNYQCQLDCNM